MELSMHDVTRIQVEVPQCHDGFWTRDIKIEGDAPDGGNAINIVLYARTEADLLLDPVDLIE